MIALVAAMAENRVIGRDGALPWPFLPADMYRFRKLTAGGVVVMGRKTYASLREKPLPGRTNVVLTRDPSFCAPGCQVVHSVAAALRAGPDLYVIGGAEVYRQFLPLAHTVYLTHIHAAFPGDTYFPELDPATWELTASRLRPRDDRNPFDLTFATYRRVQT